MSSAQTIKLGRSEYVILPKAEYLRLQESAGVPPGSVDAIAFTRASIASNLKAARQAAGLTQAELARALKKSQPMVGGAESGTIRVSERYVKAVLKACGLPEDWTGPKPKRKARKAKRR